MRILGIAGSLRKHSFSRAVLKAISESAPADVALEAFPLDAVPLYNGDRDTATPPVGVARLRNAIHAADGLLLVTPEYNCGMPGVLKNALDWASRPAFGSSLKGKPTLIVSVSPGALGGVRAHAQLRETLSAASARPVVGPQPVVPLVAEKMVADRFCDAAALSRLMEPLAELVREIDHLRLQRSVEP